MRLRLATLLAVGLAALPVAARQDPPGQPPPDTPQRPVFRTGTSTVRVDVTVTTRAGDPVRTLTAEDFEVFEDDAPHPITSFRLVEATGAPTDDYSLAIRSPRHAELEAARDDVRVFVIFWDEYHIGEFASALRAREQLTRFVLEAFGPTDLVAVVDPLTPVDAIRFTRDRRALADRIHALRGRRGVYLPPRSAIEQAHLRHRGDIEVLRSQVTTSALEAVMTHLGSIKEGRKSLLFISESLGPIQGTRVISDLTRTANHHNTAFYAFDPRGLQIGRPAPGVQLLRALAEGSGAEASQSNDLLPDMRKVVSRASAFYLLGYEPQNPALDGRFRKITVKVRPRGLEVRARSGYWQPRAAEVARAEADAAAAALPTSIAAARTAVPSEHARRTIDFWTGFIPDAEQPTVTVAWAPRPGFSGAEEAAVVEIEASLRGERRFEARLEEPTVSFDAAPGEWTIVATARNAAGDVLDREQRVLVVGGSDRALGLSTPVVLRARTPLEVKALDAGTAAASPAREFTRTDRLRIRVAPFGTAAKDAIVRAALLGARGVRLVDLPIRASGRFSEVDLPLTSVAQGEFLIRLEALSDEHRAEALVAFRVR